MTEAVSVENLSVVFDEFKALDAVSVDVAKGESFGLVGESGSGKSTLLRAVAGLTAASEGTIRVSGREVRGTRRTRPFIGRCRWCSRILTVRCIRARRSTGN